MIKILSSLVLAAFCAVTIMAPLAPAYADDQQKLETFLKDKQLPKLSDLEELPAVKAVRDANGLYTQKWVGESFLDLREDVAEATKSGKRLLIVFEQKGCIYCKKFHTEILSKKYINEYVRKNFVLLQINLWGDREVVDFDGTTVTEKELAGRWGVVNTPTAFFMPETIAKDSKKSGRELAVFPAFFPGAFGPLTTFDTFTWVKIKGYETGLNFQRFHIRRLKERGIG
ncbi:MAG: thioredoxin fold domain-containing protein [bacterium]|nr:thioredoxin fold domain-containing protein [bacterium]